MKDGMPRAFTAAELFGWLRNRASRTEWGCWRYCLNRTLECRDGHGYLYEIDLDRCRTSAEVLDWIMQVNAKTWATAGIMKDLLDALHDLLDPQGTMCSFGASRTINPREVLAGRPGYQEVDR